MFMRALAAGFCQASNQNGQNPEVVVLPRILFSRVEKMPMGLQDPFFKHMKYPTFED